MPSSWDGTACSCGAVCTSGTVTKGNNGSGPAPADAENATRPTVAPMATVARQELALKTSRLNILVPCLTVLSAPSAPLRRVVTRMSTWQRFQDGCVREPNWFRRELNYFIAAGIAGFKTRKTAKRRATAAALEVTDARLNDAIDPCQTSD